MSGIANSQNSAGKKKKNKRKVISPLDTCKSTSEISQVNRGSDYTNTTNKRFNFEDYTSCVTVTIRDTSYQLGLFDTAGQEEYEGLRLLSYPGTHVFLLSYSVVMPDTMKNLEIKWLPEVRNNSPTSAFLIVGTQIDLRDDEKVRQKLQKRKQKPVTPEEGAKLAKKVNADCYVECSSLTQQGLKDVFDEAMLAVLSPKIKRRAPRGRRRCVIL